MPVWLEGCKRMGIIITDIFEKIAYASNSI